MIEELINIWTIWHVIGAFALGLLLGLFVKKLRHAVVYSIAIPLLWEVLEANVFVSWFNLFPAETLINSAGDMGFGVMFILAGYMVSLKLKDIKWRR